MKKLTAAITVMFGCSGVAFGLVAENYPPGPDNLFQALSMCCYAASNLSLSALVLAILAGRR